MIHTLLIVLTVTVFLVHVGLTIWHFPTRKWYPDYYDLAMASTCWLWTTVFSILLWILLLIVILRCK